MVDCMGEITTVGVECVQCGKRRGKHAKPWRACDNCGKTVCLNCCASHRTPQCNKCWQEDWKKEWDEKERIRKSTPHECQGCNKTFLADDMASTSEPRLCRTCNTIVTNWRKVDARATRKRNAKPGLVEVVWGVHKPTEDGGHGYAYRDPGVNLQLGDIVMLPPTRLDREVHRKYDEAEGTVVSTYSDYDKEVQTIRRLVRRANDP